MNFKEFGVILFVDRYQKCIHFYKEVLQLEVRNEEDSLVTYNIPSGYLMVEKGGVGSESEKDRSQNPVVLRFNVNSLETEVMKLEKRGVNFYQKRLAFDWGTIAVFQDPDGNRIELGEMTRVNC
ncbi:VOC family protein [Virgibacillus oceani]|uniref:Lactoylglutathione lyase n=1 Tax=Virgibacillus oceani TaxID=1479511 RepID=A0A917M779_9BACI|nr:VOC family protein [Virgibacillus oceani]GGG83541.1 lactoylglutathione lyase [Virgibacillus oceani]